MKAPGTYRRATVAALLATSVALAAPSTPRLSYAGNLTDDRGVGLTGPVTLTFRLYDASSSPAGSELYSEVQSTVLGDKGEFLVEIGSVNPIPAALFARDLWLGVQLDTRPELPDRLRLTSAPQAIAATSAAAVDWSGVQNVPPLVHSLSTVPPLISIATDGGSAAVRLPPADQNNSGYLAANDAVSFLGKLGRVTVNPSLTGNGTASSPLGLSFAGSGAASTPARSDHDHNGTYLPLAGGGTVTGDLATSQNVSVAGTLRVGAYTAICTTGSGSCFSSPCICSCPPQMFAISGGVNAGAGNQVVQSEAYSPTQWQGACANSAGTQVICPEVRALCVRINVQ